MAMNNNPHVLVVSAFDLYKDKRADTYTINSFIGGIPMNNVYQIVCKDDPQTRSGKHDDHTFVMNHQDIIIGKYYNRASHSGGPLPKEGGDESLCFKDKFKKIVHLYARGFYSLLPYKWNDDLMQFLEDAEIDVIYTCSAYPREYFLTKRISDLYHIPIIPHVFDDWINVLFKGLIFLYPFRKAFQHMFSCIVKQSKVCFTACDLMSVNYSKRYGTGNFISLMHCVPKPEIRPVFENVHTPPYRIMYGGSLYLDRDIAIAELAEAISKTNSQDDFEIDIYAPKFHWDGVHDTLDKYSFVKYKGTVEHDEMMRIVKEEADFLLLPELISDKFLEYIRYSMSTKIPEYLASGHPIIAIGNKNQGSIDYLLKNNAAYVIYDKEQFEMTIEQIKSGVNMQKILDNAYELFLNNHEKSNQESKFLNAIKLSVGQ